MVTSKRPNIYIHIYFVGILINQPKQDFSHRINQDPKPGFRKKDAGFAGVVEDEFLGSPTRPPE